MAKFKKHLRMLFLVFLIALAVFGIGLVGGVPIPKLGNRKGEDGEKVEQLDEKKVEKSGEEKELK